MIICDTCHGNGYVKIVGSDPFNVLVSLLSGSGNWYDIEQCTTCDSKGAFTDDKKSMVPSEA